MKYLEGIKYLATILQEQAWMLAVDGKLYSQEKGPEGFEAREPGSIQGILTGLLMSLQTLGKQLTPTEIKKIHEACMKNIKSQNPCQPGEFRINPVAFEVLATWVSESGLQHLLRNMDETARLILVSEVMQNNVPVRISALSSKKNLKLAVRPENAIKPNIDQKSLSEIAQELQKENITLVYQPPAAENINKELVAIIDNYYEKIKCTADSEQIVLIIAETIQAYTRLHPFRDGNNRTFVNILLNRLLIENGLKPAIFSEPNVFEFQTPQELTEVINKAQQQFEAIVKNSRQTVFGYDNSKTHVKFVKLGDFFLNELNKLVNNMGREFNQSKKPQLAKECFKLNYDLSVRLLGEKSVNTGIALFSLASITENPQEALEHYFKSLDIFKQHKRDDLCSKAQNKIRNLEKVLSSRPIEINETKITYQLS